MKDLIDNLRGRIKQWEVWQNQISSPIPFQIQVHEIIGLITALETAEKERNEARRERNELYDKLHGDSWASK